MCIEVIKANRRFIFVHILGTRQSAFLLSLTSSGIVHSLTQACTAGSLPHCSCYSRRDQHSDGEWVWAGCDDNIKYGYKKSRVFLFNKRQKRSQDLKAQIQMHNMNAGRLVRI